MQGAPCFKNLIYNVVVSSYKYAPMKTQKGCVGTVHCFIVISDYVRVRSKLKTLVVKNIELQDYRNSIYLINSFLEQPSTSKMLIVHAAYTIVRR